MPMDKNIMEILLYFLGAIITIDKVFDIYLKFKNRAVTPSEEIRTRVTALEADVGKIHEFLDRDKRRLDANDRGMAILQKSILALIDNAIDNSDKTPLFDAKKDLNNYLVDKQINL